MADKNDGLDQNKENKIPDPNYWRSLADLHNDPKFIEASHHEFKEGVKDDFSLGNLSGISRRKFLALIGTSAALAGAGCADYRSNGEIIPYVKKPEEITVGKPNYYSSTCTACGNACGILIKTREGRPIKVDGNPDHPVSKGKICSFGHANILNLYDQERLRQPLINNNGSFFKTDWNTIDKEIVKALNQVGEKQIVFISHTISSPTTKKLFEDFKKRFPSTKLLTYELIDNRNRKSAWQKCYGTKNYPLIKWNEAKIIVSLESDFLGTGGNTVENQRLFAEGRDLKNIKNFNRLYAFEGSISLTGSNADYRLRLKPEAQFDLVMALLNELQKRSASSLPYDLSSIANITLDDFASKHSISSKQLRLLLDDLASNKGQSIIHAGDTLPENVHIAVNLLNEVLGNTKLYRTDSAMENQFPLADYDDWNVLISDMNSGNIGMIVHFDSNPVFHLPDDFGYDKALKKVPMVISITESENESSELANYVLASNHNFESWGDAKRRTGFYSLQQPVIAPIFNTRQKEAILLTWISDKPERFDETIYHKYLKDNWQNNVYPALNSKLKFDEFWYGSLEQGIVMKDEQVPNYGKFNSVVINELKNNSIGNSGYTILLRESYSLKDGRFANNGWLQELPHPVSKITWDNYAAVSRSTAKELGVESGDLIEVSIGDRKHKVAAFIQPGAADKILTIELGYGRSKVGVVGSGTGFDSSSLMSKESGFSQWIYSGAEVKKIEGTYLLATTQEHHNFDSGFTKDQSEIRGIVREGTVAQFISNPHFLNEHNEEERSLYNRHDYPGVKWGMSIDLNKCIGCGECVVACISENNVPIVGKEQVHKGREMHWLRIDRYYSGTVEDPKISAQPMLCQQCDDAPCENVCPVLATTHSPDGLNQMIYNRCVGTRYCSNNCPYKVRRFNFFNFRDHFKDDYQENNLFNLVYNPEVTVRSRGVMEKCTFCVQRIMNARSEAIKEGREVKGTDVKTACQEACGTNAINFGDMNDKNSEFYKYRHHELGYYVLEDLNTRPNVTYIAKLRNTHTEEV